MIENLLTIVYVIIIGLCGGVATFWIESLIGDPWEDEVNTRTIFSFYGVWVRHKYDAYEKALTDRMTRKAMTIKEEQRYSATQLNWAKSLGACPYCLCVWVTAIMSSFIFYCIDISMWWSLLALPLSHFSLKYLMDRF